MKNWELLAMGSVLAACATPVPPVPIPSTVTPLPGDQGSAANDVSDSGLIVGRYGAQAAEFPLAGAVTLLPSLPGSESCEARAVANDGTIAGVCRPEGADPSRQVWQAVYWDSARAIHRVIDFGTGVSSVVIDMNRLGVILGYHLSDGSAVTRWTYDMRTRTRRDLPTPPTGEYVPRAINDSGEIAGVAYVGVPNPLAIKRPVRWSADTLTITVLPTPLNCNAEAHGINNHGVVVGEGCDGVYGNYRSALVWPSATELPEALPAPASPASGYSLGILRATSVNDAGDVIGEARFSQGDIVGPTPGVGWRADRQLAVFEQATPNAINASRVTVGTHNGLRAAVIDW